MSKFAADGGAASGDMSGTLASFVSHVKRSSDLRNAASYSAIIRHLDIMTAISATEDKIDVFNPTLPTVIDVFACFGTIFLRPNNPSDLIQRLIAIMKNLADEPLILRKLASTNMYSSVAFFINSHGLSINDPLVIECLQLLRLLSDGTPNIVYLESHYVCLIVFLLSEINNPDEDLCDLVLCIMCSLVRASTAVRNFMMRQVNMKIVNRRLIAKLCSSISTTVLYAISILAYMTFQHATCEKVFTKKHSFDAIELIVRLLVKNEASSKTALELFYDFVKINKIFKIFYNYDGLEKSLLKVLRSCTRHSPRQQVETCLKFIWPFTQNPVSLKTVIRLMYIDDYDDGKGDGSVRKILHPIITQFAHKVHNAVDEGALHAFKIAKNIVAELREKEHKSIIESFEEMVQNLIKSFNGYFDTNTVCERTQMETYIAYFDLLFAFMDKGIGKHFIALNVSHENMVTLANIILAKYPIGTGSPANETAINVVISLLTIYAEIKDIIFPLIPPIITNMQDSSGLVYLAHALISSDSDCVYRGLHVLAQCHSHIHIPLLGYFMSKATSDRFSALTSESDVIPIPNAAESSPYPDPEKTRRRTESDERALEDLIQQFKSGLELKDLKVTEMLEIYDEKIDILKKKHSELSEQLSSKSSSLVQSDRLLNQYRCREAQSEVESVRLSKLMKEAEKRYENMKDIKESVQGKLDEAQVQYKQLQEKFAVVNNTAMKFEDQFMQTQEKLQESYKQIKANEAHITELELETNALGSKLEQTEYFLSKKEEECKGLEASKKMLESTVQQKENVLTNMEKQMNLLESAGRKRDETLAEKDAKIKSLSDELQATKHITEMIHKMSGGKSLDPFLPEK